jgi:hypothetical protein
MKRRNGQPWFYGLLGVWFFYNSIDDILSKAKNSTLLTPPGIATVIGGYIVVVCLAALWGMSLEAAKHNSSEPSA